MYACVTYMEHEVLQSNLKLGRVISTMLQIFAVLNWKFSYLFERLKEVTSYNSLLAVKKEELFGKTVSIILATKIYA